MDQHTNLTTLSQQLGQTLAQHSYLLSLAESCTGGLVAAAITDIAGSSAWFDRGFVTYSNEAKQEMLAVSAKTLQTHGAVSEQTATEMATGALKHSRAHVAASITGIAGPAGGSEDKPVGMVCFAWADKNGLLTTSTEYFSGNRQSVRQQAAAYAISGILHHVLSV